jgi:Flp pilus assembly protein TadD
MGVWHAEIMRLNGISRTVARAFLGGQVFGTASWAEALRHLELAVEIEPARLVHRLDLARIYRDLDRINDARAAYRAAIAAPASDPNDAVYRQHANDELKKLR